MGCFWGTQPYQPKPTSQSQMQEIQKLKTSPSPQPPAQQKAISPPIPTPVQKIQPPPPPAQKKVTPPPEPSPLQEIQLLLPSQMSYRIRTPSLPCKQPPSPQKPQKPILYSIIILKLTDIKGLTHDIRANGTQIVRQLKKAICRKFRSQFQAQLTILTYNGVDLRSDDVLNQIIKVEEANIIQRVAELWEVDGLVVDRNRVDDISEEQGMAQMPCKHWFGRDHMRGVIDYQLNTLKHNQIECTHLKEDGSACRQIWDTKIYQLVAGWTNKQINEASEILSNNGIAKTHVKCPHCDDPIQRKGIVEKKIKCPGCTTKAPFCIDCRDIWTGDSKLCPSVLCEYLRSNVANAPWTRVFEMYNRVDPEKRFPVKVPNVRLCPRPNCKQLVYNIQDCKHTQCTCTPVGYSFCYVCLSLAPEPGSRWQCGEGGYEYCGRVAPNQTYTK